MKSPHIRFVSLLVIGAVSSTAPIFAGTPNRSSSPIIITRPAIPDGSVASRAPFVAARTFDDVQRPNGQPIDRNVAPNTYSTTPEPLPAPPPQIAILVPTPSPLDPGTSLTGRVFMGVSAPLDAARVTPALQGTSLSGSEEVISDVENRIRASEISIALMKRTVDEMSPSGRDLFHSANAEVNNAEKPLRRSIRAARNANESNWETARATLAADYAAYADALARIDAAAGITPAPR
jgi:hypothetical protein